MKTKSESQSKDKNRRQFHLRKLKAKEEEPVIFNESLENNYIKVSDSHVSTIMRKNLILSQNIDRHQAVSHVYPNYTRDGSIEDNKSSETMVSGRHLQEHYQQLLRPRGIDMFSS